MVETAYPFCYSEYKSVLTDLPARGSTMITITEIGITAGEIWHYLDDFGSATLDQLSSNISKNRELLLLSLGWLAREGHIILEGPESGFKAVLTRK